MKNIFKIVSLLFMVVLFVNCENQLGELPATSFSEEQIFSSEDGLESAVNGMWTNYALHGYHGKSAQLTLLPHSGIFHYKQGSSKTNADLVSLDATVNNNELELLWSGIYKPIYNANAIIANVDVESNQLANKDVILGQAYFVRGLSYFELGQLFGGVPLRLQPSTVGDLHLPRATREEVFAQVQSDLEKAVQLLPYFGEYRTERPVKFAANMALAKFYMRLAGEDGGASSNWQKAYDEAIQVFGKYSLKSSFIDLFDINQENSEESIFELQYGHIGDASSNDLNRSFTPSAYFLYPSSIRTFGRLSPHKEIYDEHVARYPEDPRINATFIHTGYTKNNGKFTKLYPVQTSGNSAFTFINKFVDPTYNGTSSERNWIKFRYADLLLMLAEIQNELSSPADAYQYIAPILERARNTGGTIEPADWDYTSMSQEEFRLAVMKERRFELLGEGHEWFDSRRRGYNYLLKEIIEPHNSNPTHDAKADLFHVRSAKSMLLPIPAIELAGNQSISEIDQNPGY